MKLRNKKTGEIWDIGKVLTNDYPCWETLTQICEDWEDVKEPLIKNEKVRKAVKAWAWANNIGCETVLYDSAEHRILLGKVCIEFDLPVYDLENGVRYTIAELCGEEA